MKRKLFTQHQSTTADVLSYDRLITTQEQTMVLPNNLDGISVKPERSLGTPPGETKMEPDCDQQMDFYQL